MNGKSFGRFAKFLRNTGLTFRYCIKGIRPQNLNYTIKKQSGRFIKGFDTFSEYLNFKPVFLGNFAKRPKLFPFITKKNDGIGRFYSGKKRI